MVIQNLCYMPVFSPLCFQLLIAINFLAQRISSQWLAVALARGSWWQWRPVLCSPLRSQVARGLQEGPGRELFENLLRLHHFALRCLPSETSVIQFMMQSQQPPCAAQAWGFYLSSVRWQRNGQAVLRETFEALLLLSAVVVGFGQEVVAGCLGEPFEHSTFQTLTPACTDFHDIQYALLYCSHLGGNRSFLFGFWQFCTQLRFPH